MPFEVEERENDLPCVLDADISLFHTPTPFQSSYKLIPAAHIPDPANSQPDAKALADKQEFQK